MSNGVNIVHKLFIHCSQRVQTTGHLAFIGNIFRSSAKIQSTKNIANFGGKYVRVTNQ